MTKSIFKGVGFTSSSQAIKMLIQILSTAIMARILNPSDFGLVALMITITTFVSIIRDMGMSVAIVKNMNKDYTILNQIFWFNFLVSILLSISIFILIEPISHLLNETKLNLLIYAIITIIATESISSFCYAILRRDLKFEVIAISDISSGFISALIAVTMAFNGWGFWSIVYQFVFQSILATLIALWFSEKKYFSPKISYTNFNTILRFGAEVTFFNLITYLNRNIDNMLIGGKLGVDSLGLYSKAYNILMLPIRQISSPLSYVTLPALSSLSNDKQQWSTSVYSLIFVTSCMVSPLVLFAFIESESIIYLLLGSKWSASVEIFRYLMPASISGAFAFIPSVISLSMGDSRLQLKWGLFTTPFIIAGFIIGLNYGVAGVAASYSFTYSISVIIFFYFVSLKHNLSLYIVISSVIRPLLIATFAGSIVVVAKLFLHLNIILLSFLLSSFLFLFFYISICMLFKDTKEQIFYLKSKFLKRF